MARQRSILINRRIPLGALLQTETFELINIRSIFKYEDAGNKTNEIVGFVYSVGETTNYDIFDIKVEGKYPIISPDEFKRDVKIEKDFMFSLTIQLSLCIGIQSQKDYADSFRADFNKKCDASSSQIQFLEMILDWINNHQGEISSPSK